MIGPPSQCFLSYAHYDHAGFERLRVHLTSVAHLHGFALWHDRRITAGDYWNHRIQAEIDRSQVFVLLVSADFLASDYILQHELPAMLDAHAKTGALMIPVIYRACPWSGFFGRYIQALPTDDKGRLRPVMDWPKPENGFATAAQGVQAAVQDWFGVLPRSPMAGLGVPAP